MDYSVDHPFYWYRDGTADGKVVDLQTLVPSLPAGVVLTGVSIRNGGHIVVAARQADETQTTMTLLLTPIHVE